MSRKKEYRVLCRNRVIGDFTVVYDGSGERCLIVKLKDGFLIDDVPFDFSTEYLEGQRVLDNTNWVRSFVKIRVFSSGRQDIKAILKKLNLEKYDELDIFLVMNERFTQDDLVLRRNKGIIIFIVDWTMEKGVICLFIFCDR